jgi:DNA (cytosine-5)-methyltransferase 1
MTAPTRVAYGAVERGYRPFIQPAVQSSTRGALSDYSDIPVFRKAVGKFVSLYAGAGGMDIGFALAGFRPTWVNELDSHAAATNDLAFRRLRESRPHLCDADWTMHTGSILGLPDQDLPLPKSADLVIGGPPCQGFSVAGKMDPTDARSNHVFHFMEIVERVQPTAFVMENVKALYWNRRWNVVRDRLMSRAAELGYRSSLVLCNAAHYGVPQARERMLLIGVRDADPIAPKPTTSESIPTLRMALAQLPRYGEPGNDALCRAKVTPAKDPVMRRSPYAGMLFNGAGRPMDLDAPAPTLPASMGGNKTPIIDQDQMDTNARPWVPDYHAHLWSGGEPISSIPSRLRRITVQEAAAIQTFPLSMEWSGPQSAQYRQIGNAVPPRLALAVAEAVKKSLGVT